MVYKRKRDEPKPASSDADSDMDSDEREALAAFNESGFDEGLEQSEQKRRIENEKAAVATLAADRKREQDRKDEEDRKAAAVRKAETLALIKKAKEDAARANSPNRRVVFVGGLAAAGVTQAPKICLE